MRRILAFALAASICGVLHADEAPRDEEPEADRATHVQRALEAAAISGATGLTEPLRLPNPQPAGEGALAKEAQERKRGSFVVAPIPISTSTIGSGLAAVALYIFRPFGKDTVSPPTTIGIGGLYTDNGSWAAGIGGKSYFHEDRWRVSAGYGQFDVGYPFYGTGTDAGEQGISIDLDQDGDAASVEALRKIAGHWYGGIGYIRVHTTLRLDLSGALPPGFVLPPEVGTLPQLETTVASVGLRVEYDSRDDVFSPRNGTFFDLHSQFAREGVGGDWHYDRHTAAWNGYWGVRERDVVAIRLSVCSAADAPFFNLCQFGSGADLRGYTGGRYRDEAMVATQVEYRWWFQPRWGATAFVGAGEVAPTLGDLTSEALLPAGGVGLRWQVSKRQRLALRLDYAWGKGDEAFYVSIGEAF